jgi:hypothetical protein
MIPLPQTQAALVIRTDFSDHEAWEAIGAAIKQPTAEGFGANVELVDNSGYSGLAKDHHHPRVRAPHPRRRPGT